VGSVRAHVREAGIVRCHAVAGDFSGMIVLVVDGHAVIVSATDPGLVSVDTRVFRDAVGSVRAHVREAGIVRCHTVTGDFSGIIVLVVDGHTVFVGATDPDLVSGSLCDRKFVPYFFR